MRITVRHIVKEDARSLAKYANNKKVWDNLRDYFPHPYSLDDAYDFIEMVNAHPTNKIFAIVLDDLFIGIVGLHPLDDIYKITAEIGYWIGEPYWGNGYMTEAVKWITQYAWDNTHLQRVEAGVFDYNPGSMRILEKCGYSKECIKRKRLIKNDEVHDEHLYAIVRD